MTDNGRKLIHRKFTNVAGHNFEAKYFTTYLTWNLTSNLIENCYYAEIESFIWFFKDDFGNLFSVFSRKVENKMKLD